MIYCQSKAIALAGLLSLGLCAQADSKVLDTVKFDNGKEFQFIALTNNGQVQDIGVLESGPVGTRSLADMGAGDLNPLDLYYALTENREAPEVMRKLYSASVGSAWLAEAFKENSDITFPTAILAPCEDNWFLARFGDLQVGYDHHDGPDNGAYLNTHIGSYFWWRRHNIDKVHIGVCVQSSNDYTHVFFKYRTAGSNTWQTAFENYYVPQGYYYHWRCNSCTGYDWWQEHDPVKSGIYDIGADWS
ncbi:hypothetical protein [Microbulbifer spongiae]|uniref:Secreted protein n=1 Tax=Microbulbifer spongiae TaxID=2944933 RepID=A0ABY9EB23_9GAMM|nr:hypothetical protein [Microbulbifer sp. MI-G]WKD50183.1 hypothetical protein M8T91_01765 [Microbulbifer sp. MI-G]